MESAQAPIFGDLGQSKQDSKELSPRPLANAPKLLMLIKLFKILVLCWIHNFIHNDAAKTLDEIVSFHVIHDNTS